MFTTALKFIYLTIGIIVASEKLRSLGQALWQSRTGEANSGSKLLCFCRFARRIVYANGIDDVQPVSRVGRSFVALGR